MSLKRLTGTPRSIGVFTRKGGDFPQSNEQSGSASRELSHGFSVPQAEINDALWAPPKHISPEERAQLILQLKEARQDDQNERNT